MTESDKIKELEERIKELELEKRIEELEKGKEKQQTKRSGLLTASGILTIIASVIVLLLDITYLVTIQSYGYYSYRVGGTIIYVNAGGIISEILVILGVSFGLTAGIFTLKRNKKTLAIFGVSLLLAVSVSMFSLLTINSVFGVISTILIIILVTISLVFLSVAHDNFETNTLRNNGKRRNYAFTR